MRFKLRTNRSRGLSQTFKQLHSLEAQQREKLRRTHHEYLAIRRAHQENRLIR